jgi:hypothetical protein
MTPSAPSSPCTSQLQPRRSSPAACAFATISSRGSFANAVAVYELFPSATFDLSGASLLFLPTGNGGYTIVTGPNTWFGGFTNNLALSDDSTTNVTLPFPFPHLGGVATIVSPSSNGFPWLASSANAACCSGVVSTFLSDLPRIAPCWMDLNPGVGGGVFADLDAATGEFVITWSQVPEYGQSNVVSMQIALQASGIFEIRFCAGITNTSHAALTGYSMGNGAADPGNGDLSSVVTTPIVTSFAAAPVLLDASARPVLGTTINLDTSGILGSAPLGIVAFGLVAHNPGIDLTPFGAPGCAQYLDPLATVVFVPTGPIISQPFAIPNNPALAGVALVNQSAVVTPGVNALGIGFSNGLRLVLDVN